MEIRCPGCAHLLQVPDRVEGGDEAATIDTVTKVNCPNCGTVSLGPGLQKTITFSGTPDELESQQVAHFRLIRKLGQGSFGSVWLAQDISLGRQVALKLPVSAGQEADGLLREAQTAASLRHPNIVSIYEVGSDGGRAFIASEFIDGLTLRDLLSTGRPPLDRIVDLLVSISQALHHAHEHGVVHRDVKPANILLSQQGQPFVADFGIAKRLSAEATISSEGRVLGTARYMSPEQASGNTRETDRRSDIYAVGVMLFEMLTGDVPFRGNVRAILHQKMFEEAPSPRRLDPAIPKDLETICLKCLEREPGKRYPTSWDVSEELKRFRAGDPIQARPITSVERLWRRCRQRPVVASLVVSLFLSLTFGLLGVSFFWLKASKSAKQTQEALYRSQMNLTANYLSSGDIAGVRRSLKLFGPDTSLAGLRGFEWHYFNNVTSPIREVANLGDLILDVAVTRDGSLCAACGDDKRIRVWDSKTGELLRTLSLPAGRFQTLAFSPTSSHLATGSSDGWFRIYNPLKDGPPLVEIKHGLAVELVRYSSNGKRLLTASETGAVRIWNLADESLFSEIPTGITGMQDARFSPDGEQLAVASTDGLIRIWEIATRQRLHQFSPNRNVEALAYSDDGQTLVSGGINGDVRVWSIADEELLYTYRMILRVGDLEFLKDSRVLAIASSGGSLHLWNVDTHQELNKLSTHNLAMGILDLSANGKWAAIGSGDGSVRMVRLDDLMRPSALWHEYGPVRDLALLPDGKHLVAAGGHGSLKIWNSETGTSQDLEAPRQGALATLSVQPGGKLIAAAGGGQTISLWDREARQLVQQIEFPDQNVVSVAFTPSGGKLAVMARQGLVHVYETGQWQEPCCRIKPRDSFASAMIISPDGQTIVVGHDDGQVRFFDLASGEEQGRAVSVEISAGALCYCEQDQILAIGTDAGEIHLCDVASRRIRHAIKAHSGRITAITAMPDGATLISAGRDHDVSLWDTATGEPITTLAGHVRQVFSVAVSPDGNTIASGGLEGDVRIWRAKPER